MEWPLGYCLLSNFNLTWTDSIPINISNIDDKFKECSAKSGPFSDQNIHSDADVVYNSWL